MELIRRARAGTLESGDVLVTVAPAEALTVTLESPVKAQFGDQILATAHAVLEDLGVREGTVALADQGALDCTIRARVATAVKRGAAGEGDER